MKASQPKLLNQLTLFNSLPDAYLLILPDLTIALANDCYLHTFSIKREEVVGKHLKEVFTRIFTGQGSSVVIMLEHSISSVLKTKQVDQKLIKGSLERYVSQSADNYGRQYYKVISTPLLTEQGEVQYILLKMEHVSRLIRLEQQEKQQQEAFSGQQKAIEILNTLNSIFIELDKDFRYLYINAKAEESLGKRKEELLGKMIWDEFPQAIGSEGYYAIVKACRERVKVETEYLSPVLNKWTFISAVPTDAGVIVFMYDRQDIRQVQAELEENLRRLEEAQAIGRIGSFEWQLDSIRTYWSDELYRIHGLEPQSEEITMQKVATYIHREDLQELQALQDESMEKAGCYQLVHRIITPLGTLKWVNHQFESIAESEHQVIRVRGTVQDITEQKLVELQVQQQDRELLAANQTIKAAHEELLSSHNALQATNQQLIQTQQALKQLNEELEEIVDRRTRQLQIAQKEAAQQKERLYSLFMQAPGAICILEGKELVFGLVNPGFEKLFPGRELLGRPLMEALSEIIYQPILPILQNVFQTGKTYHGKEMHIAFAWKENGPTQDRYFNFIYQARRDASGGIDGVMVFAYEVTDQVIARRKAEESQRQFKILSETIPQLVWTATAVGQVDYFNGQWHTYSGLTLEQSVGQGWTKVLHSEDLPAIQRQWQQALQTGEPLGKEACLKGVNSGYRWFLIRAVPLKDERGHIKGWFGTNTDIDEQKLLVQQLHAISDKLAAANWQLQTTNIKLKEVNERLTRTNEDLDNFVYTASHDLRSPINTMEGLLAVLKQAIQEKLQPKDQELMNHLFSSMQRLNRTIADLTEIVKISKDTGQEVEPISLEELFEEVRQDIDPLLTAAKGVLVREWQVDYVRYPRKVLRSVLYNLLSNAIKYRDPNRQVQINVRSAQVKGQVCLSVQDNGLGLTAAEVSKLFQMFRRLHTHVEGSGIGLYTIKRMVENYGGTISVESIPGEGTTFYVYFPSF